jgi:hypothetical protein
MVLDTEASSLSMRISPIDGGGAFAADDPRSFHLVDAFEAVLGRILEVSVVTSSGKKSLRPITPTNQRERE